jgi:hypothetical protein
MKMKYMDSSLKQCIETRGKLKGKIAEISNDCLAVLAEGNLIYLLKDESYLSPMSVILNAGESFKGAGLSVNDEIMIDEECIKIGSYKQEIATQGVEIRQIKEVAELCCSDKSCDSTFIRNLIVLEDCIYTNGKHEGIAPVVFEIGEYINGLENYLDIEMHNNLYTSCILDKMISFMQRLVDGDIEEIWSFSNPIIGLGPGITPSSNDFLCGFMNTLVYASEFFRLDLIKAYRFNEELLLNLEYDQNKISHYMMRSSIYGKTQKAVIEVVKKLYSAEESDFRKAVKTLINFGDITGTDMLCGIYLAYRTLQSEKFRENLI